MNIPNGYREVRVSDPDFKAKHQAGRIDELCGCGRLKSEHGAGERAAQFGILSPGHGPCPASGCPQFTWAAFVEKVE